MKKIAVIGGGASGVIAAIFAAANGADVTVFEKNERPLRKLMITGKGRCNITNESDNQKFLSNVLRNPKFLYSAINTFNCFDTMEFFESLGVKIKVERGGRIFPETDKAVTVVDALYKKAKDLGVKFIFSEVKTVKNGFSVNDISFNSVIIATGGLSYPLTGSTGDGYNFAKSLGHTVNTCIPSLVPFTSSDKFCSVLSGLSLKNITFSLYEDNNKKPVFSELGEMLFCHFGISGPLVLSASCHTDFSSHTYKGVIDLKPALTTDMLDKRILRDLSENSNKEIGNIIGLLLPVNLGKTVLGISNIPLNTKCCNLTKEMRKELIENLKNFKVNITGTRPIEEAIITRGGINVSEINPKTMESKIVKDLYFAGEIIDVDAYTGGFNLQIAFSTGVLAGTSAASLNK